MNVENIRGSKNGVRVSPFLDPSDHGSQASVGASVEVYPTGSESENEVLLAAFNKAARKYKMASPIDSWSLDSEGLLALIFPRCLEGGGESNLDRILIKMAEASVPGSHWFIAQLMARVSDVETWVKALNLCRFPPRETLVLLSSCSTLLEGSSGYGRRNRYGGGQEDSSTKYLDELRRIRLKKPEFDDMDLLVSLRGLPPPVVSGFSAAVYEAISVWDFGGTAEYIIQTAPFHTQNLPALRVFGALSGVHADAGDGVRSVQGLLSPLTANFADMQFSSGFSKAVISTAKLLDVNCLTETGTPLNNKYFVSWVRKHISEIKTKEPAYYSGAAARFTPDGLVLKVMEDVLAKNANALQPVEEKISGRRKDHDIQVCSRAMAVLLGSEAFDPKERAFLLQLMFNNDTMLEKFGEVSGEIRQAHRVVEVATMGPTVYTRAPARSANLAVWLGSNGIALRFTDALSELRKHIPKLVKMRLSEPKEHRKRGYGAWLSWLTDPSKPKEAECG